MNHRSGARESGIALLMALLVLTILILLIGQMVLTGAHNKAVSRNSTAALQNDYGVLAGYHQAVVRIQGDRDRNPDVDALDDVWNVGFAFGLGSAQVSGQIIDVERRFNLSALVNDDGEIVPEAKDQLVRLIQVLGHEASENAERIADYVDADTKGAYEAGARNTRLINLQELQRVEGMKREVLFGDGQSRGILPFLTVWPKKGGLKINPNTASQEILQSLDDDMTPERALAIMTWRQGEGEDGRKKQFATLDDLKLVVELPAELLTRIAGRLAFKAQAFEIRVRSSTWGVDRMELYVAGWKGGEPAAGDSEGEGEGEGEEQPASEAQLELLGSMREHEYFDLKPDDP